MAKQPFTSDGVAAKTAELYALPDASLLIEADLIRTIFRDWVKANFTLDTAQTTYLDGMDEVYVAYLAANVGMAVANRLPVYLDPTETAPELRISKWMDSGNLITASYNEATGISATGTLRFQIRYA